MARLWTGGFETNSGTVEFDSVLGTKATIQTSVVRSGTYAGQISAPTSGIQNGWYRQTHTSSANVFFRFYLYVATFPTAANTIYYSGGGTGTANVTMNLTLDNAGTLVFSETGQAHTGSSSAGAIVANTWQRIELNRVPGSSDTWSVQVDGTTVISGVLCSSNPSGTGFFLGANGNGEAQTTGLWYFDDAAVNDNTGTNQNSWPGAGSVVHLYPAGAGDFAEGQSGPSTGLTAYTMVDESPTPDDATSYWQLVNASTSSTTADRLDVALGAFAPSVTSITLVQVGVRMMPASNAACNFIARIKSQSSGTLLESSAVSVTGSAFVTNDDTKPKNYKLTAYVDPQAAGSWTAALLSTMQVGVRSTDTTPNPQISSLWALVEYTPSAGGAATQYPASLMIGM